jgi:glyoxylase-like metal-dependent hydrolase (beta-lactamase superfamily II)
MIIEKTMSDGWLSNTWLIGDKPGGHAVLIDTGGPMEPIVQAIEENRLTVSHVLCTHHHIDHVQYNAAYKTKFGCPICGHRSENRLFGGLDVELADGDELVTGGLTVRALHTPGHTLGMLAFLVNEQRLFTGDTLFRRAVGGTRAPGHTSFEDLQHSIMEVLMKFPKETAIHPGHTDPTTGERTSLHRVRTAGGAAARSPRLRRRHQVLGALRRGQPARRGSGIPGSGHRLKESLDSEPARWDILARSRRILEGVNVKFRK